MKSEETIDFHIRWAWYGIARLYNTRASKFGITMSVGYILLNIDVKHGTPSTKLGPKMGMEARSLTRALKSLEEKGLICRQPDVKDKRMVRIYLTPSGLKVRDLSKDSVIQFNEKVFEKIAPDKIKTCLEVLGDIKELINNDEIYNG